VSAHRWEVFAALALCAACSSDDRARNGEFEGLDPPALGDGSASSTDGGSPSASRDGGASTSSGAVGNEGTSEGDAGACAELETTPVRSVPTVTFLVDGSSSMRCVYPDDTRCACESQVRGTCVGEGSLSRWRALSDAVVGAGGLVTALGDAVRFGLSVYNDTVGNPTCPAFPVAVSPSLSAGDALAAAFPSEPPGGNTPTGLALASLIAGLPSAEAAAQQGLGPQNVVLATDGQPFACVDQDTLAAPALDYEGVLAATDAARAKGIAVYVISLAPAGGDFAAHLAEVARRGEGGSAYTPADAPALATALDDIIASAISCTVELAGEIAHPERCDGSALLGGEPLGCGDADGFVIRDASTVELVGEACQRFKREPGIALSMRFPCDTFVLR
jgi:hypothetical protein